MRLADFPAVFLLIGVITVEPVAFAQPQTPTLHDWQSVVALRPGDRLEVRLKDGQTFNGDFTAASLTGLTLNTAPYKTVNRENTYRIYLIGHKSVLKGTLVGVAAGGAAGAVIGVSTPRELVLVDRSQTILFVGMIGAAAGAIIGWSSALFHGGHDKYELIYESI
jgi:hypothetical protein